MNGMGHKSKLDKKTADFLPVGKERAEEIGQVFYFTGKPCSRGHITWRRVASCRCLQCEQYASSVGRAKAYNGEVESRMLDIDEKREEMRLARELREMDL